MNFKISEIEYTIGNFGLGLCLIPITWILSFGYGWINEVLFSLAKVGYLGFIIGTPLGMILDYLSYKNKRKIVIY